MTFEFGLSAVHIYSDEFMGETVLLTFNSGYYAREYMVYTDVHISLARKTMHPDFF